MRLNICPAAVNTRPTHVETKSRSNRGCAQGHSMSPPDQRPGPVNPVGRSKRCNRRSHESSKRFAISGSNAHTQLVIVHEPCIGSFNPYPSRPGYIGVRISDRDAMLTCFGTGSCGFQAHQARFSEQCGELATKDMSTWIYSLTIG